MSYRASHIRRLRTEANQLQPLTNAGDQQAYNTIRDAAILHFLPHRIDTSQAAEKRLYFAALNDNEGYLETGLYGNIWTELLPNERLAVEHLYYDNAALVDASSPFYTQMHSYVEARHNGEDNAEQHLTHALWEILHNSPIEAKSELERDKTLRRRKAQAEMLNTFGISTENIPTPDYVIAPIRQHFQRMTLEQLLPEIIFPLRETTKTIADDIQQINAETQLALLGQKSDISRSRTISEATDAFSDLSTRMIEDGTWQMLESELEKLRTQGKNAEQIYEQMGLSLAYYQDTTIPCKLDMLATHFNGKLSEIRQIDSDISYYIWTTAHDEKVRSAHAANDGKIFAWDSPPETGHPGEDYNCRCVARPVRARTQAEIDALIMQDAIEPVYPELYVIPAIATREVASIGAIRIGSAVWRIFRNPIALRPKGLPKDWKKSSFRQRCGL